ncbi:MraY family glycosyltransferase [Rhizohabitans arisaemae]|uniref:MraY family glycosyltransferase n=1 Tax=Rhizohabitans arisaemae TaxID=2720610 RepID=UPI0024B1B273|nr:MraY family glycosyltransferase [Rhizohabitans arisaemae]
MILVAAVVVYLLVPLVRVFALKIGAMTEVRDRDVHSVPTPRLGGLGMFGGMVAGLLLVSQLRLGEAIGQTYPQAITGLLLAGGLIVVTGFLDDWWGMDPFIKFGGQVGAGSLLVYGGISLPSIPLPFGWNYILDPVVGVPVTILVVVVMINAVNFVDGLDGLAAGLVGIASLATFVYAYALTIFNGSSRLTLSTLISALVIGMCLGFLPHNFHPARIFMGDTGSMLIGLFLAASIILTSIDAKVVDDVNRFPTILPLLLPVAVMLLPLIDLIMAVVRRTSYGKSPFAPDKKHLHHRLLEIGHSHRRTVVIMYLWATMFATAVMAFSLWGSPIVVLVSMSVIAVGALVLMTLPRWKSRNAGRSGSDRGRPGGGTRRKPRPQPGSAPSGDQAARMPEGDEEFREPIAEYSGDPGEYASPESQGPEVSLRSRHV